MQLQVPKLAFKCDVCNMRYQFKSESPASLWRNDEERRF